MFIAILLVLSVVYDAIFRASDFCFEIFHKTVFEICFTFDCFSFFISNFFFTSDVNHLKFHLKISSFGYLSAKKNKLIKMWMAALLGLNQLLSVQFSQAAKKTRAL